MQRRRGLLLGIVCFFLLTGCADSFATQVDLNPQKTQSVAPVLSDTATILSPTPENTYTPEPTPPDYSCFPAGVKHETATVIQIIDGDTIEVKMNGKHYRVRYIGIDTPERDEFGYWEATNYNASLLEQREIIMVKDVSETDRYDRLLRYILVGDVFVNYELVRQGFAYAVSYPPDIACQEWMTSAQEEAVTNQNGLWQPQED